MSITCTLRLSFLTLLSRLSLFLVPLAALTSISFYYRRRKAQKAEVKRQVTKYAKFALNSLCRQKRLNEADPARYKDDFVAIVHLRDQVLQHEFDPKRREKLWEGVRKAVELNSNVRTRMREVQGEPMKCWSWVGGTLVGAGDVDEAVAADTAAPEMSEKRSMFSFGGSGSAPAPAQRRTMIKNEESEAESMLDREEEERRRKREERLAEIRRDRESRRGF
ncbi:hypothetical protein BJ508DRAFT_412310 [Ascobolus immersus RN42]|uniref:Man1/Src1-like C-terminal domain-containing protein n=1 Tax=Ascobolus immersus RN42 TaxID=1160509 RepID=A0A3N4IGD6_ASCIM|nr:hypothetical protein BJ508DRAFT_412310 [Ascobolus immersus RN42]